MSDGKTRLPGEITTPTGGIVRFRNMDAAPLRGRDVKKWRLTTYNPGLRGDTTQLIIETLFEMFIVGWEFPELPRLPLPSEDIAVIELLDADDQFEIEDTLQPMIDELNGLNAQKRRNETGPGSPTQPSSV